MGSAQVSRSSVATNMAFESELGVQPPLGFFDPLGMLNDADQERFDRLRYVEVKHGRICQLAFLGQITTRFGIHLPGDIDYSGQDRTYLSARLPRTDHHPFRYPPSGRY